MNTSQSHLKSAGRSTKSRLYYTFTTQLPVEITPVQRDMTHILAPFRMRLAWFRRKCGEWVSWIRTFPLHSRALTERNAAARSDPLRWIRASKT